MKLASSIYRALENVSLEGDIDRPWHQPNKPVYQGSIDTNSVRKAALTNNTRETQRKFEEKAAFLVKVRSMNNE